jgi:hypothetical protein
MSRSKSVCDGDHRRLVSEISAGYVCPGCLSRRHIIESDDYRGYVLRPIDLTLCITTGPHRDSQIRRAITSAEDQLFKPLMIHPKINHVPIDHSTFKSEMLAEVRTPYVAFMSDEVVLRSSHFDILVNTLINRDADLVYSCRLGIGEDCPEKDVCRSVIVARTRSLRNVELQLERICINEITWILQEDVS